MIDELRQRVLGRFDEAIDSRMRSIVNIRYVPPHAVEGTPVAGVTAEGMALLIEGINAELRTLQGMRQMVNDEINKMMAPKQEPSPQDEKIQEVY